MKKLKPIVKSEMSEDKLLLLCKIFYPENKWGSKKWYKYDINNGRKRYEPDVHSDDKKLIFEYEGLSNFYSFRFTYLFFCYFLNQSK